MRTKRTVGLGENVAPPKGALPHCAPAGKFCRRCLAFLVFLFVAWTSLLFADNTITNVISPVVSYQYPDSLDGQTNSAVTSPVVSYQFYDALNDGTNSAIVSAVVSYLYFDWPGNLSAQSQNSALVSYFYQPAALSAPVVLSGQVTETGSGGASGATVTVSVGQTQVGRTTTGANGLYQFPELGGGVYVIQVARAGDATAGRVVTLNASTSTQNFQLAVVPPTPTVAQTTKQPAATLVPQSDDLMGSQLDVFDGTKFVAVTSASQLLPEVMTIVLTHGWTSNPFCDHDSGIDGWPTDMARQLWNARISANVANIVGWDWYNAASECPLPPSERTPSQGVGLGQALQHWLGVDYAQPVHLLGHSLGTMVNAAAVNYLQGDRTAQQAVSPKPWSNAPIHVTLLDEAEAANPFGNVNALFDGSTVTLNPTPGLRSVPNTLLDWVSAMPIHEIWADNYVSLFGYYKPNAVNVILQKAPYSFGVFPADVNPKDLHSYAWRWYTNSIANSAASILGFRRSHEYDLAENLAPSTFPPSATDFPSGVTYWQDPVASDPLALQLLPPQLGLAVPIFGLEAGVVVQGTLDSVEAAGNVVVSVAGAAQQAVQDVAQGFEDVANRAIQGRQAVVGLLGSPILRLSLSTWVPQGIQGPLARTDTLHAAGLQDATGNTNSPAMAWLPLLIPTSATAIAFDFSLNGDPASDALVCGLGESNLFSLEAKYIPTNTVSASRLIDVSAWAGTTNELFFGLMGGTSTNATLQIENIRFYRVAPPTLRADISGGEVLLTWPISGVGYIVEMADNLTSTNAWTSVAGAPAVIGSTYVLTNTLSAGTRFYRLQTQ